MPINKRTLTIASTSTHVFEIASDTAVRLPSFGASWNTIRLGMRLRMSADHGAQTVQEVIAIGVDNSSGAKYPSSFGAPNTGFHGILAAIVIPRRTRNSGPPVSYSTGTAADVGIYEQHAATPDTTINMASGSCYVAADADIMGVMMLEVTRGVTDYTASMLYPNASPAHISAATLASAIAASSMTNAQTALGGSSAYALRSGTLSGAAARVVTYGDYDRFFVSSAVTANGIVATDFTARRVN